MRESIWHSWFSFLKILCLFTEQIKPLLQCVVVFTHSWGMEERERESKVNGVNVKCVVIICKYTIGSRQVSMHIFFLINSSIFCQQSVE